MHTYRGDLVVDLIAPDRHGASTCTTGPAAARTTSIATFPRNLSAYAANGTWTLRVRDAATLDVGRIDSWTLDL